MICLCPCLPIPLGRTVVVIGRIRLSVSTVNRTYELSGITHVTLFPKYGKHSTGPSTYGPWVRTYSKSFSCKPVLTVCSYRAQSNEIFTYGEVSRGSVPRVRRYGLLYLRAVEYDHYQTDPSLTITSGITRRSICPCGEVPPKWSPVSGFLSRMSICGTFYSSSQIHIFIIRLSVRHTGL